MKKTALITGASSGIGLELAKIFAREGYNLVLVARDMNVVPDNIFYGVSVNKISKDLTARGAVGEIVSRLNDSEINIDVLVNSAGFGDYGLFHELSREKQLQMIDLNVRALTELTHGIAGNMVKMKSGKIMNIASTAAFQPGPLMSVYYATKAYVLSFSQALDNELRPFGITVTALCPGPTISNFQKAASMEDSKLVRGKRLPSALEVAEYGFKSVMKGKRVAIHGRINFIFAEAVRFIPRSLATKIARLVQEAYK